jgi:O-antigen/teichoic acid export membrane protein
LNIRVLYNAGLNVLAGLSSALFAVAVPILLAPKITPTALVVWSIIMMPAAYTAVFTLGIQSVVARRVALAHAEEKFAQLGATVKAALYLMCIAALVYLTMIAVAGMLLSDIYPGIPSEMSGDAKLAFLCFGAGQATLIPMAAIMGYFYGLQNNAPVAANVVISRILMTMGIYSVSAWSSLTLMSVAATSILLAANAVLVFLYAQSCKRLTVRLESSNVKNAQRTEIKQLARECMPISVWAIATFIIYGGTSTISSILDFEHFAAYSIAVGISLMLLGLHSAAFSTLIPYVAQTRQLEGQAALTRVLDISTALSALISCSALMLTALAGTAALEFMLPTMGSREVMSYLVPLLVGNAVRLVGLPYSNALIGLGLQGRILHTPLVEAGVTLTCAIGFGLMFGAIGVAWSLAFGGLASLGMHAAFNVRNTFDSLPISAARTLIIPLTVVGVVSAAACSLHWST